MKRIAGILLVVAVSACASASFLLPPSDIEPDGPVERDEPVVSGFALVEARGGVAGVALGPDPGTRWWYGNGTAAPDGSAVFAAPSGHEGGRRVLRIDPRTGHREEVVQVEGSPLVDAVAPGGRWVALTERSPGSDTTMLTVLDPATGATRRHPLRGDVEAEAFTVDGEHLFVIRHYAHHYRIELVTVATGVQEMTLSREKHPGEDMTGGLVAAVLTGDRSVLASLYRNPTQSPGHPGHTGSAPAFVHLADLENGWTYCVDLPAPFGTGPAGDETIVADGDDVVVGSAAAGRVARIDAAAVHRPDSVRPVPVTIEDGTIAGPPPLPVVHGFERLIAVIP